MPKDKDDVARQFGYNNWTHLREVTFEKGVFFDAGDFDEIGVVPHGGRALAYWGKNPCADIYETWNAAVEDVIRAAVLNYEQHLDDDPEEVTLKVLIDRNYERETNRIIGFHLSIDSDGVSHGRDERFGQWY